MILTNVSDENTSATRSCKNSQGGHIHQRSILATKGDIFLLGTVAPSVHFISPFHGEALHFYMRHSRGPLDLTETMVESACWCFCNAYLLFLWACSNNLHVFILGQSDGKAHCYCRNWFLNFTVFWKAMSTNRNELCFCSHLLQE